MATARTTSVAVFADRSQAQQAVEELKRAGFTNDQIGVAGPGGEDDIGTADTGENVAKGAAVGAGTRMRLLHALHTTCLPARSSLTAYAF